MANNSDYNWAFDHITRVWLQTETSEIGLLLREGELGNLRRLKTYLRHPGLLEGRYTNDDGDQVELDDEQKEEIAGVSSYMYYLQNHWGPDADGIYDFSLKERSDFDMFLANHGPDEFPIEFDMETATASQLRRQSQEARSNSNSHNNSTTSEPPHSISTSSYPTNRILYNWEKGRRPISDYPTLSRAAGFLDWDRRLHALACLHKTHLVLDKDYSPNPGSDEDELSQAMKTHM